MAASPRLKIYDRRGAYLAAVKEPIAAAALCDLYGDGTTVRHGHARSRVVWHEGAEAAPAAESYDRAAETISDRLEDLRQETRRRIFADNPNPARRI